MEASIKDLEKINQIARLLEILNNKIGEGSPPYFNIHLPSYDLLTRQEAAKFCRISLPTLHKYTMNGLIKSIKLGKRRLYNSKDVDNLFNNLSKSHKK